MSIDASALDTHLCKTKLAGINSIIVLRLIKYVDFKLYVYIQIYIYNLGFFWFNYSGFFVFYIKLTHLAQKLKNLD